MNKWFRLLIWGACGLLLLAIAVQFRPVLQKEVYPRTAKLTELLPGEFPGWSTKDERVADTEEMQRAVAELLNYDEAIVRTYRRGNDSLSVYVAYWPPGRVHPRMVSQHTPDWCWTGAGWEMSEVRTSPVMSGDGRQTPPGKLRKFSIKGQVLNVVYWHLVGGDPNPDIDPNGLTFFRYMWSDLASGQREQYFIRLSSTVPFEQMQNEPLFTEVLEKLRTLGLTRPVDRK